MSSSRTKNNIHKRSYYPRYNPSNFAATMQRLKNLSDAKILNSRKNEYIAYSQSLKQLYQLQDIDLLLNKMLDNQLFPNAYIINQLIKKLSRYRLEYIDDLYRIAVNKGIADSITYNSIIDAIAKSANPNAYEAIRLLEEAKKLGIANAITYNSTIDAIAKSENPNAHYAIGLLEEAKIAGFADTFTYSSTIDAIAKSVNPNAYDAIRLLEEAKIAGFADTFTYSSTIDAIAKSVNPNANDAIRLLEEAKKLGFVNIITYSSTIDAIAKSKNSNAHEAIRLLEEAKQAGFANVITYNSTIEAIARSENPNVHDAIRLLEEAKQAGFADKYTYGSTIDAVAKSANPNVNDVIRLLEEAKKLGIADAITYNNTLNVIAKSVKPNVNDAIRLLEEAKKNWLLDLPIINSGDVVDLHGLSFGSAYFWLKKEIGKLLLNSTDIVSITFIYGQGSNSRTNGETHPIKQAVLKIVKDMRNDINDCNEIEGNAGRFHVNFQRKELKDEWHKQVDNPGIRSKKIDKKIHHSQRLFMQHATCQTGYSDLIGNSNLNPNAKPFTPSQTRNY